MERDAFKNFFPKRLRGPVANEFLHPIRRGVADPRAVVDGVYAAALEQRYSHWSDVPRLLSEVIPQNRAAAIAYATYLAEYEAMPKHERLERKRARATMAQLPPTARQLHRLNQEGIGVVPDSRLDAHDMIDATVTEAERAARKAFSEYVSRIFVEE